ncbi:MAG: diaminopimelate decarboxylase, partial [Muribaculaceae bacterium]|nr:diaminopimelate decarboxylase [Muribaculaceae bacterium]
MTEHFPLTEFESHRTPFYFYDLKLLDRTIEAIKSNCGDFHVHYALKANSNPVIVSRVAAHGLGADCVSGGEIQRALDCGIPAEKIVFAGVGKTDEEILLALNAGIGCFNVESAPELEAISALANKAGKIARVA